MTLPTPTPSSLWWRGAAQPPRRWQAEALPLALASLAGGQKALISAVMGAGKSGLIAEVCAQLQLPPRSAVVVSTSTAQLVEELAARVQERTRRPVGRFFGQAKEGARVIIACNPSLPLLIQALQARGWRVAAWIVDEAHSSECRTLHGAAELLGEEVPRLGLTATPFRGAEDERLSLFDQLLYAYSAADALRDGVIVPLELVAWTGPPAALDDAAHAMIREVVRQRIGPGIIDARSIEDAEAFAERLRVEGLRVVAVHSQRHPRHLPAALAALRAGRLDALVHVALLKEGVDLPWLTWLCLRRQVASRVWFQQHVGRVLRAAPGKTCAFILDPGGLFRRHSLTTEAALGGDAPDWSEEAGESAPQEREAPATPAPRAMPLPAIEAALHREVVALEIAGRLRRSPEPAAALIDEDEARSWRAQRLPHLEAWRQRIQEHGWPAWTVQRTAQAALDGMKAWTRLSVRAQAELYDLMFALGGAPAAAHSAPERPTSRSTPPR